MITTGEQGSKSKNESIDWGNAQVNRAGRVKGAGVGEDGARIFGIGRRNVRTMVCHVLLNENNPDTNFNWNKVRFDDKPVTKPEAYMESLKQQYISAKTSPLKKARSAASILDCEPSTSSAYLRPKGRKSTKKENSEEASSSLLIPKEEVDMFGFESEAED